MESEREGAAPKPDAPPDGHRPGKRERLADERERLANERQRKADEREAVADERERLADEREAVADERERLANEREKHLDEFGEELGVLSASRQERAFEAIKRSRALLSASGSRLDRGEAALRRASARAERDQADIDRAAAESERELAHQRPDLREQIERAKALRKRMAELAALLAATEDKVAQVHEDLAAHSPQRESEYRRTAEEARKAADHARKVQRQFAG